jgi:hypothetical protein
VISGSVTACISSIKNPNISSFDVAHVFKEGEVIHLFSNQEKIKDNTSLIFENIKLSFIQDSKNTIVYSLDIVEFKKFILERSNLTSLDVFMKLKMSELLANHIYFEGISPNKINMLGPLVSLKRSMANEVLFNRGTNEEGMYIYACMFTNNYTYIYTYIDIYIHICTNIYIYRREYGLSHQWCVSSSS